MKIVYALVAAATLALGPAMALAASEESEFTLSIGTRADKFDWNIAGASPYGNYVNVLSELSWDELESYQVKAMARVFLDRTYLRGHVDYAFLTDGVNQDSDYRGNDRTLEYSRSNNSAGKGSLWDASAGLGYRYSFSMPGGSLDLIPMVGLSFHRQNLTIKDGYQSIPATGPFGGLDSTYSASWAGPWVGMDVSYAFRKLQLLGSFEYHVASFTAEADWNLRSDFAHPVSFEHWGTATGVVISIGAQYSISRSWALLAGVDMQDWRVVEGTDRTFFASGSVSDTELNEVNWESRSVMIGVGYKF